MVDTDKIIDILSEQSGMDKSEISLQSDLYKDLNMSEIEVVDLISSLTKSFQLTLPDDFDSKNIRLVTDVISLVEDESTDL